VDKGAIELFMAAKLAVAVATMCLVGIAVSWGSTVLRCNAWNELDSVAETISASILDIQAMPPHSSIIRSLPSTSVEFRAEIAIESKNVAKILVSGKFRIEKSVRLTCELDRGTCADNPRYIELVRGEKLRVRLIS